VRVKNNATPYKEYSGDEYLTIELDFFKKIE